MQAELAPPKHVHATEGHVVVLNWLCSMEDALNTPFHLMLSCRLIPCLFLSALLVSFYLGNWKTALLARSSDKTAFVNYRYRAAIPQRKHKQSG
jgi:hypothetical protein